MKKTFFIILIIYLNVGNLYSQQIENNKPNRYYSPVIAGIGSYILPGLGQVYCGETKRGLIFAGTTTLGIGLAATAYGLDDKSSRLSVGLLGVGLVLGSYIYSITDAVKIAKRKNRENKNKVSIKIHPVYNIDSFTGKSHGLNIALEF